ncbi:alpha/beta fold hydrolase [Sandarakinorhabdus sp. DWP1-3-1]|uniref:alpha/beta fold hydrolase n=1 Tax=Sandarakinorhabdus sp. DWP1-3-1 TaxID=2804627 RepID=UPI003CEE7A6C
MTIGRRAVMAGMAAALLPGVARAAEAGVPPPDRELRVKVAGGSLYVRINGDLKAKRPPLLMVHGGPGGALWQFFPALPLADTRAVVLYDQLDSGRSDAPGDKANWTVDRFVGEIAAIRAALGLEQVHLLGHSWGGIVANRYAATRPAGLRSLVLQGAPLSARRAKDSIASLLPGLPDGAGAVLAAGAASDPAAYGKAMGVFMRKHLARTSVRDVAMPYMAPTPEDRGDAVAAAIAGTDLVGGFEGALAGFDDDGLARRVTAPTLLMCGELDIMTPAATRAMLPLFGRADFAMLSGAGHMAQFDAPAAWRDTLSRFIARHDG